MNVLELYEKSIETVCLPLRRTPPSYLRFTPLGVRGGGWASGIRQNSCGAHIQLCHAPRSLRGPVEFVELDSKQGACHVARAVVDLDYSLG